MKSTEWGGFAKKTSEVSMRGFLQLMENDTFVYGFEYDTKCSCPEQLYDKFDVLKYFKEDVFTSKKETVWPRFDNFCSVFINTGKTIKM